MPSGLTKEEYNAYMREYMLRRYHKRRARVIALLGSRCSVCETREDLQIDHIDPATKKIELSRRLHTASWEDICAELEKCQLLCQQHHNLKNSADGNGDCFHQNKNHYSCSRCGKRFRSGRALGGHARWCKRND